MKLKIGDKIRYFNYTANRMMTGTITAVDVKVCWGRFRQYPVEGVQIDGSLTRPYLRPYGDTDKSRIEG